MAWITQDSAAARVERRAEPYFTPAMKDRLTREILPRYEKPLGALMPALHEVQHAHGWIPPQAMLEIAEFLGVTPSDVIDCAGFYEEYWLKPRGRRLVSVCRSIACEICGQPGITDAIRTHLGIDVGETTDDGEWTLIELECLGACAGAPAILIDETLHEDVTPERIPALLDAAKGAPHH